MLFDDGECAAASVFPCQAVPEIQTIIRIMKKVIKETTQVEVTKSANVTPEKLATVIQQTLNSLPGTKKKKVPIVITKGDNWLCIASVVGDQAVTLSITNLKK